MRGRDGREGRDVWQNICESCAVRRLREPLFTLRLGAAARCSAHNVQSAARIPVHKRPRARRPIANPHQLQLFRLCAAVHRTQALPIAARQCHKYLISSNSFVDITCAPLCVKSVRLFSHTLHPMTPQLEQYMCDEREKAKSSLSARTYMQQTALNCAVSLHVASLSTIIHLSHRNGGTSTQSTIPQ